MDMQKCMLVLLYFVNFNLISAGDYCETDKCESTDRSTLQPRYIFYDVNPPEGFNLRRDVYMRVAIFVKKIQKFGNWVLVLPPWPHLYHWRSQELGQQRRLPWGDFFDIASLEKFVPIMEMFKFFETRHSRPIIDKVFILQHDPEMFKTGNFEDRLNIDECLKPPRYHRQNEDYTGYFWGYTNITAKKIDCVSFHGPTTLLKSLLEQTSYNTVMIDHAEVSLHERFGDKLYWQVRRSMRFASHLVIAANNYRQIFLNSTDDLDLTGRTNDWTQEAPTGGPYLCVHLRRQDFLSGRSTSVPSLPNAAQQIKSYLVKWNLNHLFIATDSSSKEINELKSYLRGVNIHLFEPSKNDKQQFKDGGVAIIEQIICAQARVFVGTHESTFSFRIQEEREIIGFPTESTFNRLCGDNEEPCSPPSKWKLVR